MNGRDKRGIDTEKLSQPLAIELLRGIGGHGEQRQVLAIVEGGIGIVDARVAGACARAVVRGRSLRQQRESAASGLVMQEQFLQCCCSGVGRGAQLQT